MKKVFILMSAFAVVTCWGMQPKKIDIPGQQPGNSALDKARYDGGFGMSYEMAKEVYNKYKSMKVTDKKIISKEDQLKFDNAVKVIRKNDPGNKMFMKCCNHRFKCQTGEGNCDDLMGNCGGFDSSC